jgi:ribosomal protein S27AE
MLWSDLLLRLSSESFGVGWPAIAASFAKSFPVQFSVYVPPHFGSVLRGVACPTVRDPVHPLPDVRRPDAVCAQYRVPAGVTLSFQVCSYSIEPNRDSRRCNASPNFSDNCGAGDLFAEHDGRLDGGDEVSEHWPQVPLVCGSFSGPGA